ncbi:hypothetical protein EIN_246680 [Entamoeba invadens IP1]|uniref:Methyltransferase domain-containing protein n=1 Tax=Entamoeba invadens IP1 TaxID=370355 RepID=A0A0A1UGD1_ENTIV|nr:hypothetical protein EIN_246680 [Entamoeba invadens IP1]ELP94784.1 hypothetical protein EIN_246680 [Entamoeba invadens IP1]|eukprot:XP_004261555.1 hypothetical protein EIN_246680 [Entamoeba invadens IP1]
MSHSTNEILPETISSYEEYSTRLLNVLSTHTECFVHYKYSNGVLIGTESPTRVLLNNIYQSLPVEWRVNFFDKFREVSLLHPESSSLVWLNGLSLILPDISIPKDISIPVPPSLRDLVATCKQLYPKGTTLVAQKGRSVLMNEKKSYECKALSQKITEIWTKTVIDIGSGKGYLLHELENLGLEAVGVEGEQDFLDKMEQREEKVLQKSPQKFSKSTQKPFDNHIGHPKTISAYLTTDITPQEFMTKISTVTASKELLMTCLHACGNLTSTLLRLSVKIPEVKVVAAVGCCYHKLTERNDFWKSTTQRAKYVEGENLNVLRSVKHPHFDEELNGFPMSKFVSEIIEKEGKEFKLAHNEFSTFADPLTVTQRQYLDMMKQQSFKAFFEFVMEKFNGAKEDHPTGKTVNTTFKTYFESALVNIKKRKTFKWNAENYAKQFEAFCDHFVSAEEFNALYNESAVGDILIESGAILLLGALFAPLLEGLIVSDRVLYMKEHCKVAYAERVFDSRVSPRCFLIVAKK